MSIIEVRGRKIESYPNSRIRLDPASGLRNISHYFILKMLLADLSEGSLKVTMVRLMVLQDEIWRYTLLKLTSSSLCPPFCTRQDRPWRKAAVLKKLEVNLCVILKVVFEKRRGLIKSMQLGTFML